jgi:hypothetical protein
MLAPLRGGRVHSIAVERLPPSEVINEHEPVGAFDEARAH